MPFSNGSCAACQTWYTFSPRWQVQYWRKIAQVRRRHAICMLGCLRCLIRSKLHMVKTILNTVYMSYMWPYVSKWGAPYLPPNLWKDLSVFGNHWGSNNGNPFFHSVGISGGVEVSCSHLFSVKCSIRKPWKLKMVRSPFLSHIEAPHLHTGLDFSHSFTERRWVLG